MARAASVMLDHKMSSEAERGAWDPDDRETQDFIDMKEKMQNPSNSSHAATKHGHLIHSRCAFPPILPLLQPTTQSRPPALGSLPGLHPREVISTSLFDQMPYSTAGKHSGSGVKLSWVPIQVLTLN